MTRPLAPPASSSFDSTVSAASLTSTASVTSSASGATAGSTASNLAAARGPGPLRIALA
ncbi:MFS transporter, partial [Burkholderia sp. Cy-647]|nr:MFS transporter [Burkholderia sp. Cy-647]